MNLRLPKIRGLLYRLSQYGVPDFIKDNWMKIVILAFALFIILKKDISLNFDLRAAGGQIHSKQGHATLNAAYHSFGNNEITSSGFSQKKAIQKVEEKTAVTQKMEMSLPTFGIDDPKVVLETEKAITKTSPKKKTKDNRANHFFNIAFILNPNHAVKKGIDKKIVEEKRHCSNFTDDTHKDFFRKYKNVWQSYRAHSIFLQGKRYAHLQKLGTKDYKGWAKGLRKAGYATDKRYADKLIKIIEVMKLNDYDV